MRVGNCGWLLLTSIVVLAPATVSRGQQFEELARRVPAGSNSLMLLNVDKILASPMAIKENWKDKHEQAYADGLSLLPPDTKQAIFANQMDLEAMTPLWESVVMRLHVEPDLPDLARQTGGSLQFIDNLKAVALPTNAYAVQFATNVVGAMTPVNRQAVGRWIRETETRTAPDLSPYLAEAFGYANQLGTPIILAIDLQDVTTPEAMLKLLKASDKFANQPDAELQRVAKLLAGIRGLTLGVTLADKPFGKVKVDFSDAVGLSPDLAKAMLLHALAKRGAMLTELKDWTPKVDGKQVTIEGNLTSSGLRRLFSLFDRPPSFKKPAAEVPLPPPLSTIPSTSATRAPSDDRAKLYAAKDYFTKVSDYVGDLRSDSYDAKTFGQIALWYDSYARKIDQMPVVGVDPEVIAYAQRTANSMRDASAQIRGANYQKGVRQANVQPQYVTNTWGVTYGYSYGWDGVGGPVGASGTYTTRDYAAENSEKSSIRAEETANAGLSSTQIMQKIQQDTASTRQRLSLKYKENF